MLASLYLPLLFLAAAIGLGVAAFSWFQRGRPGAKVLGVFAVAASGWVVAEGMTVARRDVSTMEFWAQVSITLSLVIPLAWLVLVFAYTGRIDRLSDPIVGTLFVVAIALAVLVWTNASHGLVWTDSDVTFLEELDVLSLEFGLAFWGMQVFAYLLYTAGAAHVARLLVRTHELEQLQGTALLGAISLPVFANLVFMFGIFPAGLNPTAIASVLTASIVAAVMFQTELHSVAPMAREMGREAVLTELDDAIFILDERHHLVDANPAGELLLGVSREEAMGQPLAEFLPDLEEALETTEGRADVELEREGKRRYFDVQTSALSRGYSAFSGTVVSLRDVTERRQRQQRLDVMNRLLRHNVRNELNLVRGRIELAVREIEDETAIERLEEATTTVDSIVDRSNKVGRLSRLLDSDLGDSIDIATELRAQYEAGGLDHPCGEVEIDLPESIVVSGGPALATAFEELVANAIEHHDTEKPRVSVTYDESRSDDSHAVIAVSDNGPGIAEQEWRTIVEGRETPLQHSSGIGLWLVNWVVGRAGGTLSFENTDGSTVRVRLPRVDDPPEKTASASTTQ